jgi:hypothetical protein
MVWQEYLLDNTKECSAFRLPVSNRGMFSDSDFVCAKIAVVSNNSNTIDAGMIMFLFRLFI